MQWPLRFHGAEIKKRPGQIILYGESLGGAVVTDLLREGSPAALILKSTIQH